MSLAAGNERVRRVHDALRFARRAGREHQGGHVIRTQA